MTAPVNGSKTEKQPDRSPRSPPAGYSAGTGRSSAVKRSSPPLLAQDRPPLVVAPPPGDPEVARRVPLQPEAQPLHQPPGRRVLRLDVRFQSVQLQPPE